MFKALFTSASGMKCQQMQINTIANNLANVNTNGFKASQLNFQDLLYDHQILPGTEATEGYQVPTGLEIGSGVRIVSSAKIFKQGELEQTDRNLDVCIQGRGFYRIQLADGTIAYTRDGAFGLDGQRRLVTPDGRPLADNVSLPTNANSIAISSDGKVYVAIGSSAEEQQVGVEDEHERQDGRRAWETTCSWKPSLPARPQSPRRVRTAWAYCDKDTWKGPTWTWSPSWFA